MHKNKLTRYISIILIIIMAISNVSTVFATNENADKYTTEYMQERMDAYYSKGTLIQYQDNDTQPRVGTYLLDLSSDETQYTVCSDFTYDFYVNEYDIKIEHSTNALTKSKYTYANISYDEWKNLIENGTWYEELTKDLKVGDLINIVDHDTQSGHVMMIYSIGDRIVLIHSTGSKTKWDERQSQFVEGFVEGSIQKHYLDELFPKRYAKQSEEEWDINLIRVIDIKDEAEKVEEPVKEKSEMQKLYDKYYEKGVLLQYVNKGETYFPTIDLSYPEAQNTQCAHFTNSFYTNEFGIKLANSVTKINGLEQTNVIKTILYDDWKTLVESGEWKKELLQDLQEGDIITVRHPDLSQSIGHAMMVYEVLEDDAILIHSTGSNAKTDSIESEVEKGFIEGSVRKQYLSTLFEKNYINAERDVRVARPLAVQVAEPTREAKATPQNADTETPITIKVVHTVNNGNADGSGVKPKIYVINKETNERLEYVWPTSNQGILTSTYQVVGKDNWDIEVESYTFDEDFWKPLARINKYYSCEYESEVERKPLTTDNVLEFDVTSTLYTNINGQVIFKDDFRPTELEINLLENGAVIDTIKTDASKDWKYDFGRKAVVNNNEESIFNTSTTAPNSYYTRSVGYDIEVVPMTKITLTKELIGTSKENEFGVYILPNFTARKTLWAAKLARRHPITVSCLGYKYANQIIEGAKRWDNISDMEPVLPVIDALLNVEDVKDVVAKMEAGEIKTDYDLNQEQLNRGHELVSYYRDWFTLEGENYYDLSHNGHFVSADLELFDAEADMRAYTESHISLMWFTCAPSEKGQDWATAEQIGTDLTSITREDLNSALWDVDFTTFEDFINKYFKNRFYFYTTLKDNETKITEIPVENLYSLIIVENDYEDTVEPEMIKIVNHNSIIVNKLMTEEEIEQLRFKDYEATLTNKGTFTPVITNTTAKVGESEATEEKEASYMLGLSEDGIELLDTVDFEGLDKDLVYVIKSTLYSDNEVIQSKLTEIKNQDKGSVEVKFDNKVSEGIYDIKTEILLDDKVVFTHNDDLNTNLERATITKQLPTVKINKTALNGKEIEGAKIKVTGNNFEKEWISKENETMDIQVPAGIYTLEEVVAPEGFDRVTTKIDFSVSEKGEVKVLTTTVDDEVIEVIDSVIVLKNRPSPVILPWDEIVVVSVVKKSDDDKKLPLKGAEITLFTEDGKVAKDINGNDCVALTDEKGEVKFTVARNHYSGIRDEYDRIIITRSNDIKYYAQETKAPEGYYINTNKFNVEYGNETEISIEILDKAVLISPAQETTSKNDITKNNPPKTGDNNNILLYALILNLGALACLITIKKRYHN